jgi:ATP-binding cassette subfamily B protein
MREVPYVAQVEAADCGAACLAMVVAYHGGDARLEPVRSAIGSTRDGVDALALVRGAESLGLRGRGVRCELDELGRLPPASILHWEFNHFVVFERVTRRGVVIVDPAAGRRVVPMTRVSRSFTGVALTFEPAVKLTPGAAKGRPLSRYAAAIISQRGLLARAVSMSVALRLLGLALPVLTGLVVDRVVPRGDRELLPVLGVGLAVILVVHLFSHLVRSLYLLELRARLDTRMTVGFLDHLVGLPFAYFQHRSAGDLMMRVAGNTAIRERMTAALLSSLLDGVLVVLYLALAFALSPLIALVAFGLGTLQMAVYLLASKRVRELMAADLESQARAQSYLAQMLSGIETLKAAGAERHAVDRWANLYVDELNVAMSRGRLDAVTSAVRSALAVGGPLILLGLGAVLVLDGRLSLGAMLAVNGIAIGFLVPLDALVDAGLSLANASGHAARLDDVLASEAEQRGAGNVPAKLRGAIVLRGVSFRYGPYAPLVVRDVDLEVPAGAMIAIVGRSGSGKSTLARLLLGLHRPTDGQVLYDGQDVGGLELRALRQQLGVVPQAPHVFAGSVRDNIALGAPGVSLERITTAARRACVDADVRALTMGYDTPMADGGATLSGGQRQRIALARALVHEPAVLLLDEATSSLDAVTEREVMDNLAELECTRVVIAHRLSTVVQADLIVVMEDGALVEMGTHAELLARGGVYHALVSHQTSVGREGLS